MKWNEMATKILTTTIELVLEYMLTGYQTSYIKIKTACQTVLEHIHTSCLTSCGTYIQNGYLTSHRTFKLILEHSN